MAIEITIPRLGWSMDEGTFGEWLKSDGEFVEFGEPVFTLESEKALQEVESVDEGTLHIIPDGPQEGDTVTVGTLLGYLLEDGEEQPDVTATATTADQVAGTSTESVAATTTSTGANGNGSTPTRESAAPAAAVQSIPRRNSSPDLPKISPRAARVADELGVDWSRLSGSGSTGRIREADVRAAAASGSAPGQVAASAVVGSRKLIAERMLHSAQSTAPVTLTSKVDATNLVSLRQQFKAAGGDCIPTFNDIILKLTAAALQQHPVMNQVWTDDGLQPGDGIDIGLAVDTDAGLVVPVVRGVDSLSLSDIASSTADLVERARQRTIAVDEMQGGSFTITNLGAFGVDAFTPIINWPQTAILGVGAIRRETFVDDDDQMAPRDFLTLSLTFDHQATDGAPAARFLRSLAEGIENPAPLLIR